MWYWQDMKVRGLDWVRELRYNQIVMAAWGIVGEDII
jgi:hypothetical protein